MSDEERCKHHDHSLAVYAMHVQYKCTLYYHYLALYLPIQLKLFVGTVVPSVRRSGLLQNCRLTASLEAEGQELGSFLEWVCLDIFRAFREKAIPYL